MNSIYTPKGRGVIRRRIKNAVAVQYGLCSEPIDGPCRCLPFSRHTIECLADIGPLSDVNKAPGTKLELLPPKAQHHRLIACFREANVGEPLFKK